jgi:hypothetical protein
VWVDGAIHFHTGANEQKFANLLNNPHVILITGCNQWDRGVDVVVEGDAVQITDPVVLGRYRRSGRASGTDGGSSRQAMAASNMTPGMTS